MTVLDGVGTVQKKIRITKRMERYMSTFVGDIIGEALPAISPSKKLQQLNVKGAKVDYAAADLESLKGKVTVFYHLAARQGTDKIHKLLVDALRAEDFPVETYQMVTVLDINDAMWGTAGLAKSTFEDASKEDKNAQVRCWLDSGSVIANAWELDEKSSAMIILDKDAKILAVHEGKIKADEVAPLIALVKENI